MSIAFTLESGLDVKKIRVLRWRAIFYDSKREQFYAGQADTPWEAIAWALVEREERTRNGNHPTMARDPRATPMQALAACVVGDELRKAWEAAKPVEPIEQLIARSSVGEALADVRERGIDAHLMTMERPKSAAARRSRARKKGGRDGSM